jgi:uncharacterized protein (TIGR02271 family)
MSDSNDSSTRVSKNSSASKPDTKGGAVENWARIVHKNVRTSDNQGFGKVIAIPNDNDSVIISSQGGSDQYMLPKSAVSGFNGAEVILGVTSAAMASYKIEDSARDAVNDLSPEQTTTERTKQTIPLVEERLKVTKRTRNEQATIRKEPIKETKTVEIPITYDELIIERRPASGTAAQPPAKSAEELKISLNREEYEITKKPYVKEELVIRKEPKTQTKTVTETVTSERIASSDFPPGQGSKP